MLPARVLNGKKTRTKKPQKSESQKQLLIFNDSKNNYPILLTNSCCLGNMCCLYICYVYLFKNLLFFYQIFIKYTNLQLLYNFITTAHLRHFVTVRSPMTTWPSLVGTACVRVVSSFENFFRKWSQSSRPLLDFLKQLAPYTCKLKDSLRIEKNYVKCPYGNGKDLSKSSKVSSGNTWCSHGKIAMAQKSFTDFSMGVVALLKVLFQKSSAKWNVLIRWSCHILMQQNNA